ncbi:TonB-linked outer membrane protein, SusC/RagA family [Sphingobacterium nematocida]|uniref:TonB-linked outer membrane protein, SusC/RagA family n=1 Tax=Sphingobacterium nematocida TaxID=1513896 RepID=A0A1T5ATD7_9SPHI|nr:TonB-dependent receptor [Sphingobacterium nematocida]SKB38268.1 TonB-linked outer membrane protein, SusC/RagA family [Sphingobacterium nematocida]
MITTINTNGVLTYWNKVPKRHLKIAKKNLVIMNLLTLYLLGFCLCSFGSVSAQKVSLNMHKATFQDVALAVQKQTGFSFSISNRYLSMAKPISIRMEKADMDKVLIELFKNQPFTYLISGKIISIVDQPKGVLRNTDKETEIQQERIQGRVTDNEGKPLSGVTVAMRGTDNATSTNNNGEYSINRTPGSAVIVFSIIGFTTKEVTIGRLSRINATLDADVSDLDEVVVVGYGTTKKANLTGAVSTVTSETIEGRSLTNLGQGLQGAIPNLNINTGDGRPGSASSFNIRGYNSLNGGAPLVLVDGVQIDPNQINPDDVASVTVLKDASSAAIYGGRAAYGVILITTKSGKFDAPTQVSYSFNQSFARPTVLPELVNSLDYVTMYREADQTGRLTGGPTGSDVFTDLDVEKIKNYMNNPTLENAVYIDPNDPSRYKYVGNTNWIKEMFPDWRPMSQHDLSLSGGSSKISYYSSLGAFTQKGLFKAANQKFERYNANVGVNVKTTDWLEISGKMRFNRKEDDKPGATSRFEILGDRVSDDLRPIMPVYHPDGHYSGQGSFTNPFALIEYNGRNGFKSDDIWLTGGFTLKPIKNFKVVGDLTWNSYHFNRKSNTKSFYEYGAVPVGGDITDPTQATRLGLYPHNNPAYVQEQNSHDTYSAINVYAQYENTFGKHYLKVMGGYNQEYKKNESFNLQVKNLLNQEYPFINLNNDEKPIVGSRIRDWALIGQFFRINYTFDNKYLVEINGRYDGSSRFAASDRYVFSPSVSAGWRLSEESFMTFVKPLFDDIKIRGSYGKLPNQLFNENDQDSYYPYIATMPYGTSGYIFGASQQNYITAPGLVSSNFSWEKVSTRNFGVDFTFLNRRLTGAFDVYRRDTKDMIVRGAALPAILGTGAPNRNAADLKTNGWELELGWKDQLVNGLRYFVNFNMSDNRAEITKYDLNPTGSLSDHYVGKKIGEIWGYTSNGLYATDTEAALTDKSRIWGGKWLAGDVRYVDTNNDGAINNGLNTLDSPGDLSIIGNNESRYNYGLRFGGEYKNFDLTVFLQGVAKRDLMLGGTYFWGFTNEWAVPTTASLDYWKEDNPDAYFPRQRFEGGGNFQTQTQYLQDASYLRVKQLTLGYTLPISLLERAKLSKVRFYLTSENPFVWTNIFESYDPEKSDRTAYPIQKTFAFGLQLKF